MRKIIKLLAVIFALISLAQCAAETRNDDKHESDRENLQATSNVPIATMSPALPVTPSPIAEPSPLSSPILTIDEVRNALIGVWHNDTQSLSHTWAYSYHTVFYDDNTVEHYGHRNFDRGTYSISETGEIHAVFNECRYDIPGFNWVTSTPGYDCVFTLTGAGELLRIPGEREGRFIEMMESGEAVLCEIFDNDDYSVPLVKVLPAQPDGWLGAYVFDEIAAPHLMWHYDINIYEQDGAYFAEYSVQGHLTDIRLKCEITGTTDEIQLVFLDYLPEHSLTTYERGDVLLRLIRDGDGILTDWETAEPMLYENQTKGTHFEKCDE